LKKILVKSIQIIEKMKHLIILFNFLYIFFLTTIFDKLFPKLFVVENINKNNVLTNVM
jgi:hypothetical protein